MKKTMKFEEAMKRLEEIVNALENGECPLDESLKLYGEAMELTGFCEKKLTQARQALETAPVPSSVDANGKRGAEDAAE